MKSKKLSLLMYGTRFFLPFHDVDEEVLVNAENRNEKVRHSQVGQKEICY